MRLVTTAGPAVVVRGKRGGLHPPDQSGLARIEGAEQQTFAAMALARVHPKRLVAVRAPGGAWIVAC